MNPAQLKLSIWCTSGALALLTAHDLYEGASSHAGWQDGLRRPTQEDLATESAPPEVRNQVTYDAIRAGFHLFDWTGALPPETPPPTPETGPPPRDPLDEILVLVLIQLDPDAPDHSRAFLSYRGNPEGFRDFGRRGPLPNEGILRIGNRLLAPYDDVRVESVEVDRIVFAFDDGRPALTMGFYEGEEIIFRVGEETTGRQQPEPTPRRYPGSRRSRQGPTREITPGVWEIGSGDAETIAEHYSSILSREVRTRRHRDPRRGRYDGIEIQSVEPGSLAVRHGVQSGDVIKSINEHPVSSVAEAVTFIKNNQDTTTRWVVVIENQGQERTQTYLSE